MAGDQRPWWLCLWDGRRHVDPALPRVAHCRVADTVRADRDAERALGALALAGWPGRLADSAGRDGGGPGIRQHGLSEGVSAPTGTPGLGVRVRRGAFREAHADAAPAEHRSHRLPP